MIIFIYFTVAIMALIHSAQADCPDDDKFPETCEQTGCTAKFFLTDLTAIDPYTGQICATNKCFVGGSCPSYSQSGTALASSQLADEYAGAFAARIGTDKLEDVCWYNQTISCPPGTCAIDLRLINETYGVWCGTTTPCPPGFENMQTVLPRYDPTPEQLEEALGTSAASFGCNILANLCGMELNIGNL